jgi:hypothetical protein
LYKVLDVNARVSGVFRLFVGTNDVDVVRACYLDLTGQGLPATALQPGRKWLLEDQVFFRTEMSGRKGDQRRVANWVRSARGVRELHWFAADDPGPAVMWLRVVFRWIARDAVARLKQRRAERVARADQLQALTERETGLRQELDQVRTSEAELRLLLDETRSALDESEASLQAVRQTRAWRLIIRWWSLKRTLTRRR